MTALVGWVEWIIPKRFQSQLTVPNFKWCCCQYTQSETQRFYNLRQPYPIPNLTHHAEFQALPLNFLVPIVLGMAPAGRLFGRFKNVGFRSID